VQWNTSINGFAVPFLPLVSLGLYRILYFCEVGLLRDPLLPAANAMHPSGNGLSAFIY